MKKKLKKRIIQKHIIAIVTISLLVSGIVSFRNVVKTSAEAVELDNWRFYQEGMYIWEDGFDWAYINYVNMFPTHETLDDWKRNNPSGVSSETRMAKNLANGFRLSIETTGEKYDTNDPQKIIPDGIIAKMPNINMKQSHIYKVTFEASASKRKNAYIDFDVKQINNSVVDENGNPAKRLIAITSETKTFTYQFVCPTSNAFQLGINLGAFSVATYPDGTDASDIITDPENQKNWKGWVDIKKVSIEDLGSTDPSTESTDSSTQYESTSGSEESSTTNPITTTAEPTTTKAEPTTTKESPITTSKKINPTQKKNQYITVSKNALNKIKKKKFTTKKFNLGAKSSGNGAISYSINNKKVIKVNRSGQVKMTGYGKAKIEIKASGTDKYLPTKKTINMTVNPPKPVINASYNKTTSKGKDYIIKVNRYKGVKKYYYQFSKKKKFNGKPISKKVNHVRLTVYKNTHVKMRAKASVKYYLSKSKYVIKKLKWSKVKTIKN